ncbi:MAG: RdgB/HAM1 family non-canonical purine NTP pyrophosphatase [Flavobacteriales bacterium]|nr:RdgB/HAM1 family non-canonical purine NTP pyrophosphatase [Flavobacteriales bacterium]
MKEIVFATNNENKRIEVAQMLGDAYHIRTLQDFGITEDIPEDAPTLEGNAKIKARFIAEKYDVNVFADDTGLEVDALDGAPGVITARYAGPAKRAEDNMAKLLTELQGKEDRSAQFRTAICLIIDGEEHLFEGICRGAITEAKSGSEGFGYDPVFTPVGETRTFAEMEQAEKNLISHRGLAVQKLITFLRERGQ